MTEVFKVVQLKDDGHLGSVLVPASSAADYGTPKKPKKVKECSAFRLEADARKFMEDWSPYRTLQLWRGEAETAKPNNPKNDDSRIYDCTNLTLVERLDE